MMAKRTVRDLKDLKGARVFVRVDYNVPVKDGVITDDTRIRASLPTLELLIAAGARLFLASHLGRPKKGPAPEFSLKPAAARLSELLGRPVLMAGDSVGAQVKELAGSLGDGGVVLLENVRFYKGEEANDPGFAARLIADTGATVFVNDAFGTAHRAHASTEGVSHHVKTSVAGLLMEKEVKYLGLALEAPERPFVAVLGGAKVSDKIQVIESLLPRVDALLVGGGMAYTFFRAQGLDTGKSLVEEDKVGLAQELLAKAQGKIRLPQDHVVAAAFNADAEHKTMPANEFPEGWMGLDIGPATARAFAAQVLGARLVLWNGPMGVFEMPAFAQGTLAMAKALAECPGTSIVGGGDSVAAVTQMGLADKITHVSTGGGASLEFLAGDPLPGVTCLNDTDE
ncbi:MAG TPA: phosphoglycerate kinase [Vicinamibacteria bacterium]|nr:phosphoglycerate kinase [Vicinamibacteria bacterium]